MEIPPECMSGPNWDYSSKLESLWYLTWTLILKALQLQYSRLRVEWVQEYNKNDKWCTAHLLTTSLPMPRQSPSKGSPTSQPPSLLLAMTPHGMGHLFGESGPAVLPLSPPSSLYTPDTRRKINYPSWNQDNTCHNVLWDESLVAVDWYIFDLYFFLNNRWSERQRLQCPWT